MPSPRAPGLADGATGLAGTQIGTTGDGRPIIAWSLGAINEVLDPIEGDPSDSDWSGDTDAASGGGDPSPGNGGESWTSSGAGSLTNGDTSLAEVGDEVCAWVQSDDGSTVGFWFGVTDSSNLYYVYLKPASSGGDTGTVDDFEDNDLTEYYEVSVPGSYQVQTGTIYEGTYALETVSGTDNATALHSTSGLARYPAAGDTFEWRTYLAGQYAISSMRFGVQDTDDRYQVRLQPFEGLLIEKSKGGTVSTLAADSTVSFPTGEWLRTVVEWSLNGTITATAYDAAGNKLGEVSTTDSEWTGGGTGFSGEVEKDNGPASSYHDLEQITASTQAGELRLGKYADGVGTDLDTATFDPADPTDWFLLKLGWYTDNTMIASAHLEHGGDALATVSGSDSTYSSGGVGVEFTEAGQNFDHFQRCGDADLPVVDDFEDGDVSEYSESNSAGSYAVQTGTVYEGSYALELTSGTDGAQALHSTSGLHRYPEAGDAFEWYTYIGAEQGTSSMRFGVQGNDDRYQAHIHSADDFLRLYKIDANGATDLGTDLNLTVPIGEWLKTVVEWGSGGTITLTLYNAAGTQLAQVSATDTTWTSGGVGFSGEVNSTNGPVSSYHDLVKITGIGN